MKTKIEFIWDRLLEEQNHLGAEQKLGKIVRVDETHPFNLYAGIDEEGRFILALNLQERPQSVQIKSDAFHCFRQRRVDSTWLFVLALEQQPLAPVFGRLCQDLIDASWSIGSELQLEHLFVERLLLWKRLFDMGSDGLLDESKIRGLIGELWVFRDLLKRSQHSQDTIAASWVGPLSAPQDFQFGEHSIEVKCVSSNSPSIKISSLQQLESRVPLTLGVLRLQKTDDLTLATIDLNSLAAEIEGGLKPSAQKIFQERLLEAGYVEHAHYDSLRFVVFDFNEYEILELFPKLTPHNVDDGIVDASYTISLESIELFKVQG